MFINDTATTEVYTLSLHDALPILWRWESASRPAIAATTASHVATSTTLRTAAFRDSLISGRLIDLRQDRKSTRLNSSHANISYAVFCLKKIVLIVLTFCPTGLQSS